MAIRTLLAGLFATLTVAITVGCGSERPARLKGQLLDGGQPVTLKPGEQASLALHKLDPDGTPDKNPSYNPVLNSDGTFEMTASGGELKPGTYRVVVAVAGAAAKGPDRFKGGGTLATSKLLVELKSGQNDLTLDLANPGG